MKSDAARQLLSRPDFLKLWGIGLLIFCACPVSVLMLDCINIWKNLETELGESFDWVQQGKMRLGAAGNHEKILHDN